MITTVKINPKTGLGQPINPYQRDVSKHLPGSGDPYNYIDLRYDEFEKENQPIPVITAAGETLRDGRYECEKVWQYKVNDSWVTDVNQHIAAHHDAVICGMDTRQVWKVIETPELPGKETAEENEWQIKSSSFPMADTGDYMSSTWITNGNIELVVDSADSDDELQEICDKLNSHSIDRDRVIDLLMDIMENQHEVRLDFLIKQIKNI